MVTSVHGHSLLPGPRCLCQHTEIRLIYTTSVLLSQDRVLWPKANWSNFGILWRTSLMETDTQKTYPMMWDSHHWSRLKEISLKINNIEIRLDEEHTSQAHIHQICKNLANLHRRLIIN